MFEKFTERARKVMNIARTEAHRLNSEFIGTEHILLGIVKEGGGVAAKVLKNLSVDLMHVRIEIQNLLQPDPTKSVTVGHLPFSPRAKRVLELAQESATQLGHDVIGTEHLLLGLLKENEGIAAMVLQNLGVRLHEVHDMVLELLGADIPPTAPVEDSNAEIWMQVRFTTRSRTVLELACNEAKRKHSETIGTGHILLGIIREGGGVAAKVLKDLGIDFDRVEEEVGTLITRNPEAAPSPHHYSAAARRALVVADESAARFGSNVIDTGHLLLGLLKDGDGSAIMVLRILGVDLIELGNRIMKLQGSEPPREFREAVDTGDASMFDWFTDEFRLVLNLARAEAQRLQSEFMGTEHILLGIALADRGLGGTVLRNLDVDFLRVRQEVERLLQPNPTPTVTPGYLLFSPRAKAALRLARDSAKELGNGVIGTEHLLLGLLEGNEGIAAMVLHTLGVRLDDVRAMLVEPTGAGVKGGIHVSKVEKFSPGIQPPKDSMGKLRESVEALDSLFLLLIGELGQHQRREKNVAARVELAELRFRFKKLVERWRAKLDRE